MVQLMSDGFFHQSARHPPDCVICRTGNTQADGVTALVSCQLPLGCFNPQWYPPQFRGPPGYLTQHPQHRRGPHRHQHHPCRTCWAFGTQQHHVAAKNVATWSKREAIISNSVITSCQHNGWAATRASGCCALAGAQGCAPHAATHDQQRGARRCHISRTQVSCVILQARALLCRTSLRVLRILVRAPRPPP